jgi:hypothetical protein
MADDWFDGRPYRDTLTIPSVLVLPGDPEPTEFWSRYPHAIRLPVRLVWRDGEAAQGGTPPRPTPAPAAVAPPAAAGGARAVGAPAEDGTRGASAPVPDAGADYGRGDPVRTYLRVNELLDRLMGKEQPRSNGSQAEDGAKRQDRTGGCGAVRLFAVPFLLPLSENRGPLSTGLGLRRG